MVIYACLPAMDAERVLDSVCRYVEEREWVAHGLFVDWAHVSDVPAAKRAQLQAALAVVEAGEAAGLVTPAMGMLATSAAEEEALAQWQHRVPGRPFVSTPACMAVLLPHSLRVRANVAVVGVVRGWVAECLRPLDPVPDLRDDALLCVGELLANAIQHAVPASASPVPAVLTVTVRPSQTGVYIAVDDPAPDLPMPDDQGAAESLEEHGRGLAMVGQLSEQWGWDPVPGGKRVWCTFSRPDVYGEAA
ncbi:ATP-binding protein [Streptomyces sp. AC563]|uniref:ATP-binding protein n=1 Tax=Streptomyces buecherae TaxID=2763006 RepID=UPI00164DEDD0|nr:ATP-binding protein [Streptomyces buecherae]MBC3990410.1 ATP-binding protein [Streptomyces buecherae]